MNNTNFEQADVNLAQVKILNPPPAQILIEIQEIRNDFIGWMMKWFMLEPSQQLQLQNMDPTFRQELANAIANNYAAGLTVNFLKEDKGGNVPDKKQIVVHGLEEWQEPLETTSTSMVVIPLMIRIQYS
jgi:hypothetical protein